MTGQEYVEDVNGTWYKLVDGAYTTTAPTADTANKYDSVEATYALVIPGLLEKSIFTLLVLGIATTSAYTGKEENEASIGDVIDYQLSGTIPDMTGYANFKYVLVDTASKGLVQGLIDTEGKFRQFKEGDTRSINI